MTRSFLKNKTAISTAIIAAVVIVIVIAAGAGAYYLSTQNAPNPSASPSGTATPSTSPTATTTPSASNTPTATPSATETASPSASASPSSPPNVAGASSLQYSVSVTEGGVLQGSYTYSGKNAGTANFMMRIEFTDSTGDQAIYIINGAQTKAWSFSDGQWEDLSAFYTTQLNVWNPLWQGYVNSLSAWTGAGDWSYTQQGVAVRIYDISVNPSLADSLFEHS